MKFYKAKLKDQKGETIFWHGLYFDRHDAEIIEIVRTFARTYGLKIVRIDQVDCTYEKVIRRLWKRHYTSHSRRSGTK